MRWAEWPNTDLNLMEWTKEKGDSSFATKFFYSPSLMDALTIQDHKNHVKVEVQYFLMLMHHNTSDINYYRSSKLFQFSHKLYGSSSCTPLFLTNKQLILCGLKDYCLFSFTQMYFFPPLTAISV